MQTFFIIISICCSIYFLFAKRRFDWFTVAFFSACIYFIPGYFGYTSYLILLQWIDSPIIAEAYAIMIAVLIMILFGAITSDLFSKKDEIVTYDCGDTYILKTILFFAVTGWTLTLLTTGADLFTLEKQSLLPELNRSYILFETSSIIGCVMAFEHRKWTIFALFCLFLLLDMFIGFRLGAAVAGISIFTLWLSKQGRRRLILYYWKQLSLGFIFTASLFFYKELSFAVKMADFNLLKSILSEPDTYRAALAHSEPFITQNILNEVILQQYHIGTEHLMGLVYQLILFSPELGLDISSFNDLFQNDLFPEVNYGMANNIWAEMWSSGGWPLLLIFIIIFLFFLKLFSVLTTSKNITQRTIISVMAAYWAFYIHRNDINYQIVLEKRVILILIASLICAFLIRQLRVLKNNNYRLRKEGDNNQHHTD